MRNVQRWAAGGILVVLAGLVFTIYIWNSRWRSPTSPTDDASGAGNATARPTGAGVSLRQRFFRIDLAPGQVGSVRVPITNNTNHPVRVLSVQTDCRCVRSDSPVAAIPPSQTADLQLVAIGSQPGSRTVMITTDAGNLSATVQVVVAGRGKGVDIARRAISRLDGTSGIHLLAVMHDLRGQVGRVPGTTLGGLSRLATLKKVLPADKTTWIASGDWLGTADRAEVLPVLEKAGFAVLATGQERLLDMGAPKPIRVVASAQPAAHLKSHDLIITRASNPPRNVKIIEPQLGEGLGIDLYVLDRRGWPVVAFMVPLDESLADEIAGVPGSRPDAP